MFDPPNFPPLDVCDNGKCLSRGLFLASVAQTPPLADATSFTTRRAPPDFAPIFNVVGSGLLQNVRLGAAWLMGLALLSPLAAQSPADQQAAEGTVNIYNLDRESHVGGVEIHGLISKAVASQAMQLIRTIRPDVDDLKVLLSSPGGDVLAAMELGEEIRKQWAWTAVDENGECFGACVLVLAAGVRRIPTPENVGLQRMNFDQKEFVTSLPSDKAKQKYTGVAKRVETYLARMGMPKKLFQEMSAQQSSAKVRLLDAAKLKSLGLDGIDPAYEQWLRENNNQQPPQSN